MKVNIAIPCYNEQNTIKECINNLENLGNEFQISIYNDGSSDETLPNIIDNQKIRVLSSKINYGLADVFNSIIHDSIQENFDYIIIFDADNQYPSDEIKLLLKTTIDNKLDICLGTRNFKNNKVFSNLKT
jgi:glycosyltransferase involved in cell wall biosynthesis